MRVLGFVAVVLSACGFVTADAPPDSMSVWLPPGAVARLGSTRLRHAVPALYMAFAADGKTLYSGGADGSVRAWDVATGEQKPFAQKGELAVRALRLTHAGKRLAVRYSAGPLHFLDPATLAEVGQYDATTANLFDISADGKLIVTIDSTGAKITELDTELTKLELPDVCIAAFHPDSKQVVTADEHGVVTLYRVAGGKPLFTVKHGGALNGLVFRPDGKMFATGGTGSDGGVKLWEPGKPDPIAVIPDSAGAVAFIGEDRLFAVKGFAHGVYDLKKKEWVRRFPDVTSIHALSPDGTKLAAGSSKSVRVRLWDVRSGDELHAAGDVFPDATLLAPSADGRGLFLIAAEKAYFWQIGERNPTHLGTFSGPVHAAATGGKRLVVTTADAIHVWDDFSTSKPLPERPSRSIPKAVGVKSLALSLDGSRLVYSGDDKEVWLADPAAGRPRWVLPVQTTALALSFSAKGDHLAILGRDGFLRYWHLPAAGKGEDAEVWKVRVARGQGGAAAISPDGKRVAATASNRLLVLNAKNGTEEFNLDRSSEDGPFHTVAFTPDGRYLVTGSGGTPGAVQLIDVATHAVAWRFSGGLGGVNRLVVFADGTCAASAGADDAVTVWDLTRTPAK